MPYTRLFQHIQSIHLAVKNTAPAQKLQYNVEYYASWYHYKPKYSPLNSFGGLYVAYSSMILLCVCNDALLIFLTKNGYADDDK